MALSKFGGNLIEKAGFFLGAEGGLWVPQVRSVWVWGVNKGMKKMKHVAVACC